MTAKSAIDTATFCHIFIEKQPTMKDSFWIWQPLYMMEMLYDAKCIKEGKV